MNKLEQVVLFAVIIAISSLRVLGQGASDDILIKPYEKLTDDVLKNFKQDHDDLMSMQTSDRQLKTKLWLKLLEQIDKTQDLNFNFNNTNNQVSSNVGLPMDPTNPKTAMYFSGTAPSSIEDPEIRAAFEKALEKNHKKYLRIRFERELQRLDEDSTVLALRYFHLAYAKTPADAKELIGFLDVLTDSNHKTQLKKQLGEFVELANKQ